MTQNINMKIEKSTDDTYPSNVADLYVEKEEITNKIKYKVKGHYIKSKKKKNKVQTSSKIGRKIDLQVCASGPSIPRRK